MPDHAGPAGGVQFHRRVAGLRARVDSHPPPEMNMPAPGCSPRPNSPGRSTASGDGSWFHHETTERRDNVGAATMMLMLVVACTAYPPHRVRSVSTAIEDGETD